MSAEEGSEMGNECRVFFFAVTPSCVTSAQPGEHRGGSAEAGLSLRAEMKPADPRGSSASYNARVKSVLIYSAAQSSLI